ncbi:MAG: alpha/beta fold hydrolase [Verrucomicrobiales bacterium]|nr:alpha/beta fold hydrolase [Verrucomicrobiales bacterium]
MPLVPTGSYRPPALLRNGHLHTIAPSLLRRVPLLTADRQRIPTPDGDFLDIDYYRAGNPRVAVIAHGLEGDSRQPYVQGLATALARAGYDIAAWNLRGCSGSPNLLPLSYHSGATNDLHTVLTSILTNTLYQKIVLAGFSLGGNITLKYLADHALTLDPRIAAAVAFSVPCDLAASATHLGNPSNRLYMARFLVSLTAKIRAKQKRFPGSIDTSGLDRIRTFKEFDDRYTAPLHGFRDAADYWARASSGPALHLLRVPALLVNALDDPFLPPACYPRETAAASDHLFLETPPRGGHVGFVSSLNSPAYWSESRAVTFFADVL